MADVEISYKGSTIASMSASGTKTLLTEGKYCEDDITVEYTSPGGGGGPSIAFQLKDQVITSAKWTAQNCIPNLLANGGCVHIKYTLQFNSSTSSDCCVFAFGVGSLTSWTPGSTNISAYALADKNGRTLGIRFRGIGNEALWLDEYSDANDEIEIKLYTNKWLDVKTNIEHTYTSGVQSFMTALANVSYISVGQNQSTPFSGATLTLFAIEGA